MTMFPAGVRIAMLCTTLLAADAILSAQVALAQTPAPGRPAQAETVAPPPAKEASFEEKYLAFENPLFTARWGWMALIDGLGMTQDSANVQQVTHVSAKAEPRADRLFVAGLLKFRKPWRYTIGTNFNGLDSEPGEHFSWLDLAVDIPINSWLGGVNFGRQKVGVSQEWIMPGTDWIFMERSGMANSFIPQRNIGLRLHNSFAHGRITYSAGVFNDWFVNDRSFSANGTSYAGRISFLPVDRNQGETVVSIATAVYYKDNTDEKLKFRSRPEANQSPYFVDTGSFAADHATTTQFELMAIDGPTQVFGEWMLTPVDAPTVDDPFFHAGFVGASHFLTGEHRSLNRNDSTYSRFAPRSPFSFRNGGRGAWEVATRYSFTDLTDGPIDGGVMKRLTGAVSWYPDTHWRLEFNYGYGILDKGGTVGHFNAFQGRIQVGF